MPTSVSYWSTLLWRSFWTSRSVVDFDFALMIILQSALYLSSSVLLEHYKCWCLNCWGVSAWWVFAEVWWFGGGGWERICVIWFTLICHSASLSGCSLTVPRHSGPHTKYVFFLTHFKLDLWLLIPLTLSQCIFEGFCEGNLPLNYWNPLFPRLQPSRGMKASEWSSPTWSYSFVSSFVMTYFPTTSTCARLFPVVTWLLTPTCPAHAPPVTNPQMNQSAKSRRQAATARMRHVGGSCCGAWWVRCAAVQFGVLQRVNMQLCCWFNRTQGCRSRWKLITTPVLILTRYTDEHFLFPSV